MVDMPWFAKKSASLILNASDPYLARRTHFVSRQELVEKLGSQSTHVDFGGQYNNSKPICPDNLDQCVSLDDFAQMNSITANDLRKAKLQYAK